MNDTPQSTLRRDSLTVAVGFVVLLIGTATGNAVAMIVLAAIGFIAIAMINRDRIQSQRTRTLLAIVTSASVAYIIAFALTQLAARMH
ncbi:MAG: hypothetical protein KDB22_29230 [Planctomycetales bacterium]|nr:hypothetical protein [Planctomycetaceae bacterium]MCA9131216.1 hypothetical protein [Planctomycetales bacterium]